MVIPPECQPLKAEVDRLDRGIKALQKELTDPSDRPPSKQFVTSQLAKARRDRDQAQKRLEACLPPPQPPVECSLEGGVVELAHPYFRARADLPGRFLFNGARTVITVISLGPAVASYSIPQRPEFGTVTTILTAGEPASGLVNNRNVVLGLQIHLAHSFEHDPAPGFNKDHTLDVVLSTVGPGYQPPSDPSGQVHVVEQTTSGTPIKDDGYFALVGQGLLKGQWLNDEPVHVTIEGRLYPVP
jgi:hypothetical protein